MNIFIHDDVTLWISLLRACASTVVHSSPAAAPFSVVLVSGTGEGSSSSSISWREVRGAAGGPMVGGGEGVKLVGTVSPEGFFSTAESYKGREVYPVSIFSRSINGLTCWRVTR